MILEKQKLSIHERVSLNPSISNYITIFCSNHNQQPILVPHKHAKLQTKERMCIILVSHIFLEQLLGVHCGYLVLNSKLFHVAKKFPMGVFSMEGLPDDYWCQPQIYGDHHYSGMLCM